VRTTIAAALILSAVIVPGAAVAVQQDPPGAGTYSRADIESGSRLFAVHCTSCHGTRGDAVPGVERWTLPVCVWSSKLTTLVKCYAEREEQWPGTLLQVSHVVT